MATEDFRSGFSIDETGLVTTCHPAEGWPIENPTLRAPTSEE
jgi:hypothetical protein